MSDFIASLKPADPQAPALLAAERALSTIDVEKLANHLFHRGKFLEQQKAVLAVLEKRPIFSKKNLLNLSRPERFHLGLARAKEMRRLSVELGWGQEEYHMAMYLTDELSPYALHTLMFETSIREQCNEEQKAYWTPKVENWEIIGAYGQTELGHGSNVRGIETEARWDQETKEFVIHSPTLTAAKWWNGSLGRTANHAIVVAQLMLPSPSPSNPPKYTSYGPHQFIVQVRDLETNKPLEGIVIGDIGPKYGYTSMDNGYMLFHHFHVPHSALMSKYSGVDIVTGAYLPPKYQALSYGSMTFVRSQIVMGARMALSRAVTISIRYTAVRLQFADKDAVSGAREEPVLNYPTVQIRLLPLLATTYALHYTGEAMLNLYWGTRAEIEKTGQSSQLAEMHAASSALKSLCTTLAADGIEVCRRALGGHGYGGGSGFISLNNEYMDKPTVEGDNWMITQQTASYLLKRMTEAVKNPTASTTTPINVQFRHFLANGKANMTSFDVYANDGDIVAAFQHRTSHLVYQAYQARIERKESWTNLMLQLHRMSIAFAESLLVSNFHAAVFENAPVPALDSTSHSALKLFFRLYSLFTMEAHAAEFILSGSLQAAQLSSLTKEIQTLMAEIRPHAVRLVDAWSIPDYLLNSSLGRSDGDVYNDLFRKAHLENPLNIVTFNPDWKTEEIVKGEGVEVSRRRIEALVRGVEGHEQAGGVKSRL